MTSNGVRPMDAGGTDSFEWATLEDADEDLFQFPGENEAPPVREVGKAAVPLPVQHGPGTGEPAGLATIPRTDQQTAHDATAQRLARLTSASAVSEAQPRRSLAGPATQVAARAPRPAPRLRAHLLAFTFAVLTLLVIGEAVYILKPGWFRAGSPTTTAPVSQAAVPPAGVAAAPGGNPTPEPASTGTSGNAAAASGRLDVQSEPSGATVSIDGRHYGVTPLTLGSVTPGARRIVLRLGGREVRQTVRVEPGATASVIAPMRSVPVPATANASVPPVAGSGWVAIASAADLDIMEEDVLVGSTRSPQVMMPAGLHTLRLVSPALGYETVQQVRVEPGKVARLSVTLPEAMVHLNAQPWAEVFVDGTSVGETPIGNLPVRIGTHQIVFRHPELGEKAVPAVVRAGTPTRVSVDLRK